MCIGHRSRNVPNQNQQPRIAKKYHIIENIKMISCNTVSNVNNEDENIKI